MGFLSKKMKKAKKMTALFCAAAFSFSVHGNDLSKIQQQIKQQEQKIAEQKREQNKLQSTLKIKKRKLMMSLDNCVKRKPN